jgi:uncharacterized membrane protein YkvA (DUF1232 family)
MLSRIRIWARKIRWDGHALYFAARDPRTPWFAKLLALLIAGYALSPIDLIPDFIPIVGYLDDLIIVPCGIWLVIKLIPEPIMAECRAKADQTAQRPISRTGMIVIVLFWIAGAAALGWAGYDYLAGHRQHGTSSDSQNVTFRPA